MKQIAEQGKQMGTRQEQLSPDFPHFWVGKASVRSQIPHGEKDDGRSPNPCGVWVPMVPPGRIELPTSALPRMGRSSILSLYFKDFCLCGWSSPRNCPTAAPSTSSVVGRSLNDGQGCGEGFLGRDRKPLAPNGEGLQALVDEFLYGCNSGRPREGSKSGSPSIWSKVSIRRAMSLVSCWRNRCRETAGWVMAVMTAPRRPASRSHRARSRR